MIHDLSLAAEGTDGESSSDNFTQGSEIGCNADTLLSATEGETETCHDFVEYK